MFYSLVLTLFFIVFSCLTVVIVSVSPVISFPKLTITSTSENKNFATWMSHNGHCAVPKTTAKPSPASMIISPSLTQALRSMGIDIPPTGFIPKDRVVYDTIKVRIFRTHLCDEAENQEYVVKIIEPTWNNPVSMSSGLSYLICLRSNSFSLDTDDPFAKIDLKPHQKLILAGANLTSCPSETPVEMLVDVFIPWLLKNIGYGPAIKTLKGSLLHKDELLKTESMVLVSEYLDASIWITMLTGWRYENVSIEVLRMSLVSLITLGCNLDEDFIYFGDAHMNNFMIDRNTGLVKLIDFGGFYYGKKMAQKLKACYALADTRSSVAMNASDARISNLYFIAQWFDRVPITPTKGDFQRLDKHWRTVVDRELDYPGSTCNLLYGTNNVVKSSSSLDQAVQFLQELFTNVTYYPHPFLSDKRRPRAWPNILKTEETSSIASTIHTSSDKPVAQSVKKPIEPVVGNPLNNSAGAPQTELHPNNALIPDKSPVDPLRRNTAHRITTSIRFLFDIVFMMYIGYCI